jgi:hypothetical protein
MHIAVMDLYSVFLRFIIIPVQMLKYHVCVVTIISIYAMRDSVTFSLAGD